MIISKLKIRLILLFLSLILIPLGLIANWGEWILFLSAIGLLVYSLIEIDDLVFEKMDSFSKCIRIVCLALIFFGLTLYQLRDVFKPLIVETEVFSKNLKNISYKNDGGPHHNIYFKTKLPIERPINLKIKDTYNNLDFTIDYDLLNRRIVFINYAFGNQDAINQAIANKGLVFAYEARDWLWGSEYKLYRQKQESLEKLGRLLTSKV